MAQTIVTQTPNKKYIGFAIVIVAGICVVSISYLIGSSKLSSKVYKEDLYAKGFNAAREMAYKSGVQNIPLSSLSGAVTEVSSDSIKIKTELFVDERVDGIGQERTVFVSKDCEIASLTEKDIKVYNEENAQFIERLSAADRDQSKPLTSPDPYVRESIKISDIKVGDVVSISVKSASSQEQVDLRLKDQIDASSVSVYVKPKMIEPTPAPIVPTVPSVETEPASL